MGHVAWSSKESVQGMARSPRVVHQHLSLSADVFLPLSGEIEIQIRRLVSIIREDPVDTTVTRGPITLLTVQSAF